MGYAPTVTVSETVLVEVSMIETVPGVLALVTYPYPLERAMNCGLNPTVIVSETMLVEVSMIETVPLPAFAT